MNFEFEKRIDDNYCRYRAKKNESEYVYYIVFEPLNSEV